MMGNSKSLPPLAYLGNEKKKLTLHLFLQIMGKIRMDKTPRKNHWWYITEYVDTKGYTTGPIPYHDGLDSFTLTINVIKHLLEFENSRGDYQSFALSSSLTVADFYNQITDILKENGTSYSILAKPFDLGIEKKFDQITEYHHYDEAYVSSLWQIMHWVDSVFKEFSGRFYGKTCPVQLYWHSMDLTVTRFSGKKAPLMNASARLSDKDAYSHEVISFGFWAGDETVQEPAFYSYTYPSPDGIASETILPSTANWVVSNGSPMALFSYNDLLKQDHPKDALLNFLESTYQAGAKLADWDIDQFKVPTLDEL